MTANRKERKRMKLAFYSVVLNQHQAPVADALYGMLGDDYVFVETTDLQDSKGGTADYSERPYLLRAWQSEAHRRRAMELAETAECCVFSGLAALPFQKARMARGLLSLDMSERWLKRGIKNLFSPAILNMFLAYHLGGWGKKPLYKLCASAYAAHDDERLGCYKGRHYKWGYFTGIPEQGAKAMTDGRRNGPVRMMWCARFIDWKHPEMPVELANRLKEDGRLFHIDMYGEGPLKARIQDRIDRSGLTEYVSLKGNRPNDDIQKAMQDSDIFLFTSDRQEGWGAVANEAMANGCCLVGADEIGAVPFLVRNGENGLTFKSKSPNSLYGQVKYLLDNPLRMQEMAAKGSDDMRRLWSPRHAAASLLQLIDDLKHGRDTSIAEGPCSKA